jgi:hypothetical protein
MRILAGGQVLEDIDYNSRAHEQFRTCSTTNNRNNEKIAGTGQYTNWINTWGSHPYMPATNADNFGGVYPGDSQTVMFKPLAVFFKSDKMHATQILPITN